jgi:hypothetical protein
MQLCRCLRKDDVGLQEVKVASAREQVATYYPGGRVSGAHLFGGLEWMMDGQRASGT